MPEKVEIRVMGYRCTRCGHEWVPRASSDPPRVCPKCKSPYWDRQRRPAQRSGGEQGAGTGEGE